MQTDRDLMVPDEPSVGRDAAAESDVHARLREVRSGCPCVFISHRLGAVRDADLIVVLADGWVAEQGTRDDLLGVGSITARPFTLQTTDSVDATDTAGTRALAVPAGDRP